MFMKTLTAGVLAVSLTLTSLTPSTATAQISEEDAIAGIITLLLLGAVVHNSRDRSEPATPQRQPRAQAQSQAQHGWRVLPAQCLHQVTRRNGNEIRFFGQRCLNRSYAHTERLPAACHVSFRTQNGQHRQGYRARCMQNQGFRTNRH